jgi:hypothetical protein
VPTLGGDTPSILRQSIDVPPVHNLTGPTSDSGYASLGQVHGMKEDNAGEREDDTQTIRTDNQELNIEQDVKEKLGSAFSNETLQRLQDILGNWSGKTRERPMTTVLADSLREFSIRLRSMANLGEQKDATVFVRHYRR